MNFEHFSACRPIAGDLDFGVTDAQPRTVWQLHDRHAFDGDVLAQNARFDGHAALRQLIDRFGVQNADLALWSAGVSVTLETEVGDEPALRLGELAKLFLGVRIDRNQTRMHYTQWYSFSASWLLTFDQAGILP